LSLIPVPGGIGVVEGGRAVGLSSAGMPQASAVLLYRIAPAAADDPPWRYQICAVRTASLHPRNRVPKPLTYNE
jgi:hypothetical protein